MATNGNPLNMVRTQGIGEKWSKNKLATTCVGEERYTARSN